MGSDETIFQSFDQPCPDAGHVGKNVSSKTYGTAFERCGMCVTGYWNNGGRCNTCSNTIDGCLSVTCDANNGSGIVCTTCDAWSNLYDGICKTCASESPGCAAATCLPSGAFCFECLPSYWMIEDGNCTKCGEDLAKCERATCDNVTGNDAVCTLCESQTILSVGTNECVEPVYNDAPIIHVPIYVMTLVLVLG